MAGHGWGGSAAPGGRAGQNRQLKRLCTGGASCSCWFITGGCGKLIGDRSRKSRFPAEATLPLVHYDGHLADCNGYGYLQRTPAIYNGYLWRLHGHMQPPLDPPTGWCAIYARHETPFLCVPLEPHGALAL
jgi:hypothetical protein